jgi:hypothetical protein
LPLAMYFHLLFEGAYIGGAFRVPMETRGCGSVFTGSVGSHIGAAG